MKKKRIQKLLWAGLMVCCAFSPSLLGKALATDPVGETDTLLAGPTVFGDLDVKSHTEKHLAVLETAGMSDVYLVQVTIAPGGHTGWHSHPGILLGTIQSGVATEYQSDDPNCTPHVHPAGTGFTEEAGQVHLVRNEGSTDLVLVVLLLIPSGEPGRIDQPDPGNCH